MTEAEALRTGFRPARGRYCQSATAPEQQPAVTRCGFERWPVKVLTDKDASTVDFKPKSATIAELAELPPPHSYPQMNRLAPVEVTVFRVPAVVRRVHFESDSDIHVVLSDPGVPSDTIIAEIPAPDCAVGSGHETDFATARKVALRLKPGTHVMVVGVGFFDKTHGQASSARNGIELHPVLLISPAESEK